MVAVSTLNQNHHQGDCSKCQGRNVVFHRAGFASMCYLYMPYEFASLGTIYIVLSFELWCGVTPLNCTWDDPFPF